MFGERVSQTFNLGLEVLTGCAFSCLGCTIEKNRAPFEMDEVDSKAILDLLVDLKEQDFRLLELKIGPTDITSSDNGMAVLQHPTIKEIAKMYRVITINMSMLNDTGLVELAEALDELAPGKYVNVGIPFTLKNVCNSKYMNMIKVRVAYFRSLLKRAKFTRIYATLNVEENNLEQFTDEAYTRLRDFDFGDGFDKVIEFPFVKARSNLRDIVTADKLKRDIKHFAAFVKTKVHTHEFVQLIPGDKEGYEFTYRDGKLYSTIVLIENLTVFEDGFALSKPWSADTVIGNRMDSYNNILTKYSDHPECGDCCYFDNCARCDVQSLMEVTNSNTCLIDMKNRWDYGIAPGEHDA